MHKIRAQTVDKLELNISQNEAFNCKYHVFQMNVELEKQMQVSVEPFDKIVALFL